MGLVKSNLEIKKRINLIFIEIKNIHNIFLNLIAGYNLINKLPKLSEYKNVYLSLESNINIFISLLEKIKFDTKKYTELLKLIRKIDIFINNLFIYENDLIKYLNNIEKNSSNFNNISEIDKKYKNVIEYIYYKNNDKIINLITNNLRLIKSNSKNKSFKDFFPSFKKNSITKQVILNNNFNINKDKVSKVLIYDYIINLCDDLLKRNNISEEAEANVLLKRNKNINDIEKGILSILFNTIYFALENNIKLIKSSNINIIINLFSENRIDSEGVYFSEKSNSKNIYMNFSLGEEYILSYITNVNKINIDSNSYNTIIHELTHAFDFDSNAKYKKNKMLNTS